MMAKGPADPITGPRACINEICRRRIIENQSAFINNNTYQHVHTALNYTTVLHVPLPSPQGISSNVCVCAYVDVGLTFCLASACDEYRIPNTRGHACMQ